MKYVMMIYCNPVNWGHPSFLHTEEAASLSEREREEMARGLEERIAQLRRGGELIEVMALADPLTSRTLRSRGDAIVATDGPFVEGKEQMAGLFVLDCESMDRAQEIASSFPDARYNVVELRPVM
jgi:hypothetical protein